MASDHERGLQGFASGISSSLEHMEKLALGAEKMAADRLRRIVDEHSDDDGFSYLVAGLMHAADVLDGTCTQTDGCTCEGFVSKVAVVSKGHALFQK